MDFFRSRHFCPTTHRIIMTKEGPKDHLTSKKKRLQTPEICGKLALTDPDLKISKLRKKFNFDTVKKTSEKGGQISKEKTETSPCLQRCYCNYLLDKCYLAFAILYNIIQAYENIFKQRVIDIIACLHSS